MSTGSPLSNAGITVIRHKIPASMRIILGFSAVVVVLGLHAMTFHPKENSTALTVVLIMILGCSLLYYNHAGYRIAWDDQHVHMRPWGFRNLLLQRHPWRSLRYENMTRMRGTTADKPSLVVTTAMPFQVLEIQAKDDEESIALYGSGLNDDDLSQLLAHLDHVRPDLSPLELS